MHEVEESLRVALTDALESTLVFFSNLLHHALSRARGLGAAVAGSDVRHVDAENPDEVVALRVELGQCIEHAPVRVDALWWLARLQAVEKRAEQNREDVNGAREPKCSGAP